MCQPGYTGKHCDVDIDDCASNPCKNGGRCRDGVNTYECFCANGWEGPHCDININECLDDPCVNGTCSDTQGSYDCSCYPGVCGKNCDREDPCQQDSMRCKNDGQCVPTCDNSPEDGFFSCLCTEEWEGEICAVKVFFLIIFVIMQTFYFDDINLIFSDAFSSRLSKISIKSCTLFSLII